MTDRPEKASTGRKLGIGCGVLVLAVIGLGVIGSQSGSGGAGQSSGSAATPAEAATNDPGISAAEFEEIRPGMSEAAVDLIVGSSGEVVSESDIAGVHTVMVQWAGESGFGANANAMFQDGRLIQKAQFGLR